MMKHPCTRLFLLLVALSSASALVTCPAVSTTAIQCYVGAVYSGGIPTGGFCDCSCYSGQDDGAFSVSSSAGCSSSACATKYPSMCSSNPSSTTTYNAYSDTLVSSPQLAPAATGAICGSYTYSCSTNQCNGLPTGTFTVYFMFTDETNNGVTTTAATNCGSMATAANSAPAGFYTMNSLCATTACNAPKTSSASSTTGGIFASLASVLMLGVLIWN
jgi:hypothetical protein